MIKCSSRCLVMGTYKPLNGITAEMLILVQKCRTSLCVSFSPSSLWERFFLGGQNITEIEAEREITGKMFVVIDRCRQRGRPLLALVLHFTFLSEHLNYDWLNKNCCFKTNIKALIIHFSLSPQDSMTILKTKWEWIFDLCWITFSFLLLHIAWQTRWRRREKNT